MSTPTATPTCGELSCDECNARTATLETELARLRALFPAICSALGNGAFCTPDVSIGFLESIPNEVASVVARLRAELVVEKNWVEHHSQHADDLIGENVKLRADLERLTKQIKDDHRSYGCELRDPNGTIWEQAAKDHARAEKAEAECVEQARLLGMSGEREAALLSALKLMVSKFDAFIDSEYCGTDLLAEQLAQADFARKVIMGEARK